MSSRLSELRPDQSSRRLRKGWRPWPFQSYSNADVAVDSPRHDTKRVSSQVEPILRERLSTVRSLNRNKFVAIVQFITRAHNNDYCSPLCFLHCNQLRYYSVLSDREYSNIAADSLRYGTLFVFVFFFFVFFFTSLINELKIYCRQRSRLKYFTFCMWYVYKCSLTRLVPFASQKTLIQSKTLHLKYPVCIYRTSFMYTCTMKRENWYRILICNTRTFVYVRVHVPYSLV